MQNYVKRIITILLSAVLVLFIVMRLGLPVEAQTGQSCGNAPADIMLIIDTSGGMGADYADKLRQAKQATKNFVDIIARDGRNRIGLISFSDTASLDSGLTSDSTAIKNKIDTLNANGWSCHECAIAKANQEISANGRVGIKKVIIMLTDGISNAIIGGSGSVDSLVAEQRTLDVVTAGFIASKTFFFTIGLGVEGGSGEYGYNPVFLEKIASLTGGKTYSASGGLETTYQNIYELIAKGSLGGFIFNDMNGNGIPDSDEPRLNAWSVQLVSTTGTKTSATSGSTGKYTITGLCDGNYRLKEISQSDWRQTLPSDSGGYPITISNGSSYMDKNFGNKIVQTISLAITVYEHGVWNSGDSTNPIGASLSNKNPAHPIIEANLELLNANKEFVLQGKGSLAYDKIDGDYKGVIAIPADTFSSDQYYVRIKTATHLKGLAPGMVTITAGQTNIIPAATLVTGDANNDNKLQRSDYDLLLDCYSVLSAAKACDANKKIATDFNDDSVVNEIDYNLFLREIAAK